MKGLSVKNGIAKLLSIFGIGVYRIRSTGKHDNSHQKVTWKDFKIESPVSHNTPDRMNDFFSDERMLEQYLDESRINFYNELIGLVKSKGLTAGEKDILDAGCGTGHLLKTFTNGSNPKSISGCDFSQEAIKIAKKTLPLGHFFSHDIYKPFSQSYEMIFCTEVLEHLIDPEIALKNLSNALKKSSVLIVTVPNGRVDFYEGHINFWSPESWEKFLKENIPGLKIETGMLAGNKNNFAIIKN